MSIRRVQQYNHTIPVYSRTKKLRLELVSVFSLLCFFCVLDTFLNSFALCRKCRWFDVLH